jgi:DNA modification methylase
MRDKIIHGDCLEIMMDIPAKSIDMILCDLPYGTTQCSWDSIIPFERLWLPYKRIIKDKGAIVLFGSQPFTSALIMSNPSLFKYEWIWEKSKASNFLNSAKEPLKAHENILVFYKKPPQYNPQKAPGSPFNKGIRKNENGLFTEAFGPLKSNVTINNETGLRCPRSVQYFITAEREGKLHPTQKPVSLCEFLIKTYTNEGMTVLDNCAGSGTTAIACINSKRHYICIEKEEKYFNIASERIKNHVHEG